MGRSLNQIVEELRPERRERVEARYQALKQEVEGLRQLRQIAGKAQLDIVTALNIKQPSVSEDREADRHVSVEPAQLCRGDRRNCRSA
jgi:hypothetical protein